MNQNRFKGLISWLFFLAISSVFSQNADAQIIIDNLTGGTSEHQSTIYSDWSKHEWDIIFPVEYRGQQISAPVLYYRVGDQNTVTVNGGFTSGNDGAFIVSSVDATMASGVTPPGTDQSGNYLVFDFSGQTLDVPADGVVWFRFDWVSGDNYRLDIGALGTYTTTYEQNDNVRAGGTSFAIYGGRDVTPTSIPTLSPWALVMLSLMIGLVFLRRYKISV